MSYIISDERLAELNAQMEDAVSPEAYFRKRMAEEDAKKAEAPNDKLKALYKEGRKMKSDGGSTSYYRLPEGATELNDLIEAKGMGFALGNIFKACYRMGEKDGADVLYDLNKIIFFAERLKGFLAKNGRLP